MKYYKSKRGYFYKIVGDKKIRISIQEYKLKMKGGTVKSDGNLEITDFNKENTYRGLPQSYSQITQEMLDNITLKVLRKPFYLAGEPVIFFGGNNADKFTHACDNDSIFSKKINFFKLTSTVIPISIDKISTIDLIELFYGLKNIRKENRSFMNRLYKILEYEIMKINRFVDISNIHFKNRNKIKELTKFSGPNFITSNGIKQSLNTLKSLTSNPEQMKIIYDYLKQKFEKLISRYPDSFKNIKGSYNSPFGKIFLQVKEKFNSNQ